MGYGRRIHLRDKGSSMAAHNVTRSVDAGSEAVPAEPRGLAQGADAGSEVRPTRMHAWHCHDTVHGRGL